MNYISRNLLCSIVILSYNQLEYTKQCLNSIKAYTKDVDYEIIIVDNASHPETVEYLEKRDDIILIKNSKNEGFAGGCNQGIKAAHGKYIMLLNNDTVVTERWLYNMVQFLEENQDVSMVGPLTNATVGKQKIEVPYGDDMEQMQHFANAIATSGAEGWRTLRLVGFCMLIRKVLFDEIGLFDTRYAIGNYEDDDFNIRALCAGKKSYICRNSFIHHFMSISFGQKDIQREQIMMNNKLLLENKWHNMNWNHHVQYNQYMLDKIIEHKGKKILHIGCGLGALGIELKEADKSYHISGIEMHPIRRQIASEFLDEMLDNDSVDRIIKTLDKKYDIIVIEGMLEVLGIELLRKISYLLNKDGIVLVRVFNIKHISTLEKLITGKIEGRLLCASSDEFCYFYDKNIKNKIKEMEFELVEEKKIIKTFSNKQCEIYKKIEGFLNDTEEPHIYNRIYYLRILNR